MQVSNQCMALVRDGVLVPTKDAPELAYVRYLHHRCKETRVTTSSVVLRIRIRDAVPY